MCYSVFFSVIKTQNFIIKNRKNYFSLLKTEYLLLIQFKIYY